MTQSFNLQGIKFFFEILKNPQLAIPHLDVKSIRDIDPEKLRELGFKGIVWDKDNTLTNPYALEIHYSIEQAYAHFKEVFGDNLVIFSNSAGTRDDKNHKKARTIEDNLGIVVIRHELKKPEGIEDITRYFSCNPESLVMIGDRYFTDVAFGNRYGMLTARVQPFTSHGDNLMVKLIRPIEERLVAYWKSKGVIAPEYKF